MNQVDRKTKTYLKIFYEMTIFNDLSIPRLVLVLRSLKMGINTACNLFDQKAE